MAKRSRKYLEAAKLVDRTKRYPLEEAVELAKQTNIANFDATVEVVFRLNLDPAEPNRTSGCDRPSSRNGQNPEGFGHHQGR